jgi:ribosomal protein S18 acetylase RimI-like enzyme
MTVRARVREGEVFQWRGEQARLGTWRSADDTAYLAFLEGHGPTPAFLSRCTERLRQQGFTSVLTSAVPAEQQSTFEDAGFAVHQVLHFLAHDLHDLPPVTLATRRGRPADHPAVARLDRHCFDAFWALDELGLAEVLDATPVSRLRIVDPEALADHDGQAPAGPAGPAGYAVSGRAGTFGYLQRLAVDPTAGGRGVGRALVADSLHWLRRRGARRAYVNTQVDNETALRLYRSSGFRELPTGLLILDRTL